MKFVLCLAITFGAAWAVTWINKMLELHPPKETEEGPHLYIRKELFNEKSN